MQKGTILGKCPNTFVPHCSSTEKLFISNSSMLLGTPGKKPREATPAPRKFPRFGPPPPPPLGISFALRGGEVWIFSGTIEIITKFCPKTKIPCHKIA